MKVLNKLETEVFKLTKAILIRTGGNRGMGGQSAIASVHDIAFNKQGVAELCAGSLMTKAAVSELVRSVTPEQSMRLIPSKILATGVEGMMWWKKPSVEMVWFNTNGEDGIGARCGRVPLPGLVFVVSDSRWYVFAVKGDQRPDATTHLYQAPFYNVDSKGLICRGNAELPSTSTVDDMDGFERAFFQSRFTHPNLHSKKGLSLYRGGASALWLSMLAGKKKVFPEHSLVPMACSVAEWLDSFLGKSTHPSRGAR